MSSSRKGLGYLVLGFAWLIAGGAFAGSPAAPPGGRVIASIAGYAGFVSFASLAIKAWKPNIDDLWRDSGKKPHLVAMATIAMAAIQYIDRNC